MALQVALSRIIITKAPRASLAADTSHSRPHRVARASTYDVYEGFLRSVRELVRLLDRRTTAGNAKVARGDARKLGLPPGSVDLIVTSPPYLNAIDYLRGHRLALIWMGYSVGELRDIRADSVGSERALNDAPSAQVERMVKRIEGMVPNPEHLPRPIISRYARDLSLMAAESFRVCKTGARVVTVVGNSTLRGNFIRNDLLVRSALTTAGFRVTSSRSRDLPASRRYMPVTARDEGSALLRRMRSETVLAAIKD